MIQSTQVFLALIEGIGLIASPCILPVLPIVLAASADGGRARPLGIISGFIITFTAFALLSRQLISALDLDPTWIRHISLFLLMLMGSVMIIPALAEPLTRKTQGLADWGLKMTDNRGTGFAGGLAIGGLIALIWTPCAGPIMAAAVVQIIQAKDSLNASLTILMFVTGAAIPMLAIALFGRQIMARLSFFKKHAAYVRQGLGAVIVIVTLMIWTGLDVKLLTPSLRVSNAIALDGKLQKHLADPYAAAEITGATAWLNGPPLTLAALRGQVVLLDFWTYSCINCIRTFPWMTAWHEKYKDEGLVIIGIHSPEFAFEKKAANVKTAAEKFGIHYPIALDNDFNIWDAYHNRYWPAHYLIDRSGQVVYTHFGEGGYDVTEHNIRTLLETTATPVHVVTDSTAAITQSPESYLGYDRLKHFATPDALRPDKVTAYALPAAALAPDHWALSGRWKVSHENITAAGKDADGKNSALRFHFRGGRVFLVMGTQNNKPQRIKVLLDGKPITQGAGADVANSHIIVRAERLYEIIRLKSPASGVLELQTARSGLKAYAFTFGQ